MSSSSSNSMFKPKSNSGKWVLFFVIAWLIWLTITHPSEAVVLFGDFFSAIGDLFSAIFQAYQEGRK